MYLIPDRCKCSKSVMWEFKKQDKDRNKLLSNTELEVMAANRREPCMKPLLKTCDTDGDGALTHGEWCCCMAYTSKYLTLILLNFSKCYKPPSSFGSFH